MATRTIANVYRKHAREPQGPDDGRCAAVRGLLRRGDGLGFCHHLHPVFADGVCHAVAGSDFPSFQRFQSRRGVTFMPRRRFRRLLATGTSA